MLKPFAPETAVQLVGKKIVNYFVVTRIEARQMKNSPKTYLALTLANRNGSWEGRKWRDFADIQKSCPAGSEVKVEAMVEDFQGECQLAILRMRCVNEEDVGSFDRSDLDVRKLMPVSEFPPEQMDGELRAIVAAFGDDDLRRLVLAFLDDEEIGPAFRVAPAAKVLHHAWISGLLEHVLALVKVLKAVAPFYPEVNEDLLLTGAILHDIGKVKELSWKTSFHYTLEGQLVGHISIAQGMLREKVQSLQPFPEKKRVLVEHMILSHHGKYEFGSPKLPMTPEAMLLSAMDDLEAKFSALRREFAGAESAGRKPDETTEWVRSMDRPLFNSARWLAEEE